MLLYKLLNVILNCMWYIIQDCMYYGDQILRVNAIQYYVVRYIAMLLCMNTCNIVCFSCTIYGHLCVTSLQLYKNIVMPDWRK